MAEETRPPKTQEPLGDFIDKTTNPSGEDDTINSLHRYRCAKLKLKELLEFHYDEDWGFFDFPEIDVISEEHESSKLQVEITKIMDARKQSIDDLLSKCKGIVERAFEALSPFAKDNLENDRDPHSVIHSSGFY